MSALQPSGLCLTCEAVIQAGPGIRGYKPFKTARELLDAADLGCYVCWTISHTRKWIDATPKAFQRGLQYNIITNVPPARFPESERAVTGSGSKIIDFLYSPFRRLFQPSRRPPPSTTFAAQLRRNFLPETIKFESLIVAGGRGDAARSWTFRRPKMTGLLPP